MNAFTSALRRNIEHSSARLTIVLGIMYVFVVGLLDHLMPGGVSFPLFYMLGISYVAWRAGKQPAILLSLVAASLMAADDWRHLQGSSSVLIMFWNALTRASLFSAGAWLIGEITRSHRDLSSLVAEKVGQYQAIMATAMDGFAIVDSKGRIADVNDTYCRMLGCRKEDLIGATIASIELKESPQEVESHMARIRSEGGDRFETRHRHKDGSAVDIEVSTTSLPGSNGVMIAFIREIGERKKSESRLRESEERYRSLAESSPDAIVILDRQFRVAYANSSSASLWKRAPAELLGLSQADLFGAEIAEAHTAFVRKVFETGEPLRHDEFLPFPAGDRWNETRLVPVQGPSGTVHSVIIIGVDINERKRMESLLQAQRDLGLKLSRTIDLETALQALLQMAVKIEGVDCGGVYLFDPRTESLQLGATEGVLSEQFISAVSVFPAGSQRVEMVLKGQPVYGTHNLLAASPKAKAEDLKAIAILPLCHEGVVIGSLHLGSHQHDIIPLQSRFVMETVVSQTAGAIARIRSESQRQQLEGQILEISDREQARIGQELHDGLCQQLVSLAFDANSLHSRLEQESRSEASLAGRIAKYLDDSITEARHLARGLFPIRLDADGLSSALEELAQGTTARYGVHCVALCDSATKIPNASTAVHLYRIAQEAVSNIVKHARAGHITISLSTDENQVRLCVEDDGIGFTPGARADSHGMGLHIMEYRARTIGGTFALDSTNDRGVAVCCCIPLLV